MATETVAPPMLTFERTPTNYRHWQLEVEAPLARLTMKVDPDGGALGDYALKLNSYDIGVDIELADAVRRIRFEHPEVRCVILGSAIAGTFCAGANIRMLAAADHGHKVNFCKFTNETRLEIEEASTSSGLRFLAAINGACSGGGYEVAMACDHLLLVDDRSSAVSLPEVPLLGVLPGTGGLTRLTDKRLVRRDHADVFATRAEGVRGEQAVAWRLVDEVATPSTFDQAVVNRALALAATSDRNPEAAPVVLAPLQRTSVEDEDGTERVGYRFVAAVLDRLRRLVTITITADPGSDWPLAAAREFDDLMCHLRFNEPLLGTWVLRTVGSMADVLVHDERLAHPSDHADRETSLLWKRVLSRLDLSARSLIALIEPGSCFGGVLAEVALAADRSYMLTGIFEDDEDPLAPAELLLTEVSGGTFPMINGLTRLGTRFWKDAESADLASARFGQPLDAATALELGLVTFAPDDLDWEDEVRVAIDERASFSPDALTAMEANHRFVGPETMATKIFSRLSAWQNWIFIRPNATGPDGALRRYGSGIKADFDFRRC